MASPTTTHVIEIETGIGEPAFIPLSMGQELQPISVGKKGMWRIESPRVLDVHAFIYFDGTSLFLQSADEANAASVDGYRVGKAWTELHAPCKIEIGTARLRFRSLIADADHQPTMMAPSPPGPIPPGMAAGPPIMAPMPTAGAPPPYAGQSAPHQPPPMMQQPHQQQPMMQQPMMQQPQPAPSSPPVTFPKAERPFKPGEFSSGPDLDESTRIAPLDATGAGRVASGSHPRPAAGQPIDDGSRPDGASRMSGVPMGPGGSGQYGAMGMQPGMAPPGMGSQPGAGMQPGMSYPSQPGYGGFPNPASSGGFDALQPGMQQFPGGPGMQGTSAPPGGYGSMTPQGGMQQPAPPRTPMQEFVEKLKANSIPKIVAGLLFITGGILYLAEDEEPEVRPRRKISATADGGVEAGIVAASGSSSSSSTVASPEPTSPPVANPTNAAPEWPPGVPCPPPNWPAGTPLPCTPNAAGTSPDKNTNDPGNKPDPKDVAPAPPSGTKTLERQAVDAVAAGDTAKAAAAYEELVAQDPNNKVYAEAARILRAKLDGGAPGR